MIGAGWCTSCSQLTRTYLNPRALNLTENLGAEIVYLEIQDTDGLSADNEFAYLHLQHLIDNGVGWRVGALSTVIRSGDQMISAPHYISSQESLPHLPNMWVIRKRDMRIIATRDLAFMARPGELPLELIAMDPEQDWSDPPPPPFYNQCKEGEDEETAEEPNNVIENATLIEPGEYTGGICDSEPDFYTVALQREWRFTLDFDSTEGDLDLALWDKEKNTIRMDDEGNRVGSFGSGNRESVTGEGPALIKVYGYNNNSANYMIKLQ
jgi:hypothetical protein